MKSAKHSQSATSLPRSAADDVSSRLRHYAIVMGIRTACFILMVVITPYSWYTWVLGAAAVFLPYVAVVFANNGGNSATASERPDRELPATPTAAPASEAQTPSTIVITETPQALPAAESANGTPNAR